MRVIKHYPTALRRQVGEAVRIRRRGEAVLNSKAEFNRCKIVRLTIPESDPAPTPVGPVVTTEPEGDEWAVAPPPPVVKTGYGKPLKSAQTKRQSQAISAQPSKRARLGDMPEDWGLESAVESITVVESLPPQMVTLSWSQLPQ